MVRPGPHFQCVSSISVSSGMNLGAGIESPHSDFPRLRNIVGILGRSRVGRKAANKFRLLFAAHRNTRKHYGSTTTISLKTSKSSTLNV